MIRFTIVLCVLGCIVINVDAEEQKNLLTDGGFEAPVEILRENHDKGHIVTNGWMLFRGRDTKSRCWQITTQTAVEGGKSFRMTNTTGEGNMHLKMLPERPVTEFEGPYRISCRIKTRGRANPAVTPILFFLGERKHRTGLTSRYNIAEIRGNQSNTDWTQYSAVVHPEDVRFESKNDLWFVSVLVKQFKGSVWVDDVRLVSVDAPALRVRLNSRECFLHQRQMIVRGQVNPKRVALWKALLDIMLLDSRGNVILKKRKVVKSRQFTVPLDIAGLPESEYTVKVRIVDVKGKSISLKRTFRRTEGPIPSSRKVPRV